MINYLFIFMSVLSPLVPIFMSFSKYKYFNFQLKVLFYLLCLSFVVDAFSIILSFIGFNTIFIFNFYIIVNFILASIIIIKCSNDYKKYPIKLNLILAVCIALISIVSIYYQDGFEKPNIISNLISGVFIIILSIQWFYFLLIEMTVKSLKEYYVFWIISGFLISSSFSLFVNISEDYIRLNEDNSAYLLWIINLISNIIFNFFIANGIFKYHKN